MSTCQAFVPTQLGPEKKKQAFDLSVIIAHFWAESYRSLRSWSEFKISQCILPLRCTMPLLCFFCHDPFIVRRAQTCPPITGFTQLAHPSRCSRSTLATVYFCALDFGSPCVCVPGLQFPSSRSGVWDPWSIGYQSCKLAMLLQY